MPMRAGLAGPIGLAMAVVGGATGAPLRMRALSCESLDLNIRTGENIASPETSPTTFRPLLTKFMPMLAGLVGVTGSESKRTAKLREYAILRARLESSHDMLAM